MFTEKDKAQMARRGSDMSLVLKQIEYFKKGFPYIQLVRPATPGDGLQVLNEEEKYRLAEKYEKAAGELNIAKFVPASGAASRMFKDLFAYLDSEDSLDDHPAVSKFIDQIRNFAFFDDLTRSFAKKNKDIGILLERGEYKDIIRELLEESGLNYGNLPKGLLQFHRYPDGTRTPTEEHLTEGALYARGKDEEAHLHFTVSPHHMEKFSSHVEEVRPVYEKRFGVRYTVDFSVQKPHTDTIAVDLDNNPFRNDDGSLLFRPAGHGALIENLNEIDADIIFIKNIDNVVPDHLKDDTVFYKKVLAGKLLELGREIDHYISILEKDGQPEGEKLEKIRRFLREELCIENTPAFDGTDEEKAFLKSKLNRPLRVCGMVKNEGEPGGGPFFAVNPDGTVSLQIAESAQIDPSDSGQKGIAARATHFNPVDLVCRVKDYKGKKYHLPDFIDPQTGFISIKSKDGRELKALELPGLWNGSMSDWNTVFVEVPVTTFNPVKTVNDLLRPQHQMAE